MRTTPASRRMTAVFGTLAALLWLTWLGCQTAIDATTGPEDQQEEEVTGSLAQVVLVPSSATLSAGQTQQFFAYGRLSEGDSVGVGVTFSATGGAITSQGLYTAGGTAGTYQVVVQETDGTLSDTAGVIITGGGSTEPGIYSWGFETLGGPRNDRFGLFSNFSFNTSNPPDNINAIQDASKAARGEWYAETYNVRTDGRWPKMALVLDEIGPPGVDELYVRFAVYQTAWANEGFKTLRFFGDGAQSLGWLAINTSGKLQWVFTIGGSPNSHTSDPVFELGQWLWIETHYNVNPGGRPSVRVWANDQLVIDVTHDGTNTGNELIEHISIPSSGPDLGASQDVWVRFDEIGVSNAKMGIP